MRAYRRVFTSMLGCLFLIGFGLNAFAEIDNQNRYPYPVPLGVSGGNIQDISRAYCCGGTLGALVQDANRYYIISNNHVLARTNKGEIGENIIQPGLIDQLPACSQDINDKVATLTRFIPISFKKGTNTVDAAIAEIVQEAVDPTGFILNIGSVSTTTLSAFVGLAVKKSGRTTGFTKGSVAAVDVTVDVAYDKQCGVGTQIARFVNQMLITPGYFSAGGDSGSLIVEDVGVNPRPVGLLFAGSSTYTLANPIDMVLESLCVAMVGSETFPDPNLCVSNDGGGGKKGGGPPPGKGPKSKNIPFGLEIASKVKARHEERLLGIHGVVGTGLSYDDVGQAVIETYLERLVPETMRQVPDNIEGIPVRIVETGLFLAR
ncbi:MAG: Nal1-like putative serine protease [Planctomycetota bacterium]